MSKNIEEYYKWISEHDLTLEEVFIISLFKDEMEHIIVAYLSSKNDIQKKVYFQKFIRKNLLETLVDIEEFSIDNYRLTEEGLKIAQYLSNQSISSFDPYVATIPAENIEDITGIKEEKRQIVFEEVKKEVKEEVSKFDKFVEEFREKFPKGSNGGGVSFKGNFLDVKKKLHKFMNTYKYSMDVIIKARDLYLKQFQRKGFEYCQAAEYFILKNGSSTLAGYCELVEKDGNNSVGNPFEQLM